MKATTNCLISIVVMLSLTACGGSGGSGDHGSDQSARGVQSSNGLVRLDRAFFVGPETQAVALTGVFERPESITVASSGAAISLASFEQNRVFLRLPEVDRPVNAAVTLEFRYPGQNAEITVNVAIENASAADLEQQVTHTLTNRDAIMALSQDAALYNFFLQLAYLQDELSHQELVDQLAAFKPQTGPWAFDANFALDNLVQIQEQYRQGLISEQVLQQELAYAERMIANHGVYGRDMLRDIGNLIEPIAPGGFVSGVLEYVASAGLYSRILSSDRYVIASNGSIALRPEYASLAALVQFN